MLVCPGKLLQDYLNGIHLVKPDFEFKKLGEPETKQLYIKSNSKNLFSNKFDDYNFIVSPEDAFHTLAEEIKNFSSDGNIKFNFLIVPFKAVEFVNINIFNEIIIRCISYYDVHIDDILTRYDVLIEKVN